MKKSIFQRGIPLAVVYLFFLYSMQGQNNPLVSSPAAPSPTAAALGEQSVPVNLYSGTAQISVPLFNLESDHANLPVGLGYNSTGIKVEQMASEVGLGWGLSAGGVITRGMNGFPDDCYLVSYNDGSPTSSEAGYLHGTGSLIESLHQTHPNLYSSSERLILKERKKDVEPDVFFFNFSGYSGQFVFDTKGKAKLFSDMTLQIDYDLDNNLRPSDDTPGLNFSSPFRGGIRSFTITTTDGMQYVFENREIAYSKNTERPERMINPCDPDHPDPYSFDFDYNDPVSPAIGYISAWHLSRIINPFGNRVFTFYYDRKEVILDHTHMTQASEQLTPSSPALVTTYFTETATIKPRLSEIRYGPTATQTYGKLNFIYSPIPRDDVYYPQDLPGNYNYVKSAALNQIEWLDSSNKKLKEYLFLYSTFLSMPQEDINCNLIGYTEYGAPIYDVPGWLSPSFKRLRLNYIRERSIKADGTVIDLPPYELTYNDAPLPPRLFPHQDFWGYYNGGSGVETMLPELYVYPGDNANNAKYQSIYSVFPRPNSVVLPAIISGADRFANEEAMKMGILERITYPTGGHTAFSYGAHEFDFEGVIIEGGGLRIEEMVISDGNGNDRVRSFEYFNGGTTSGRLINYPRFARYKGCAFSQSDPLDPPVNLELSTSVYSHARNGFGTTYGTPVGYTRVVENQGSNGRAAYLFNLTAYAGVESADNNIYQRAYAEDTYQSGLCYESKFPFPLNPNYDWSNGLLLETQIFATDNTLVKKIENEYNWVEHEKIYSVKSYYGVGEGDFAG
ncbi:MAG: hypothetical protein AAGG75_16365, partial [Bacteroidota bacterium]